MKTKLILIGLILFTSCVTQRKCLQKFPPTSSRDSVYIETVTMKPVPIPSQSLKAEALINCNCPDGNLIKVENEKLKQEVFLLNGKIISNTEVKPDTVYVPQIETKTEIHKVKVPQPVKFVPKFYRYTLYISIVFALFLAY